MLKLVNISKDYIVGNTTVNALKGVSVAFRENEFVSILGASGCGKTTLLNIVGGLDKYSAGDLMINGVSTKKFKSKDWDSYRNHSIGFVFQNYNLINHLTILKNVELALTISGVGRKERKERAIEALTAVGLEEQINKKPNQLSGGQMQRVAIARAIVNNPQILLADEPTGALDSKTSVQIMEILKEISKNRLIIMVTHNPELADEYSTRIIKLADGEIVDDSNPYVIEEPEQTEAAATSTEKQDVENSDENAAENASLVAAAENEITADLDAPRKDDTVSVDAEAVPDEEVSESGSKKKKSKKVKPPKTSMSYFTALSLSLRNLMTKKGRTIVTAIAGSIGILGIGLVLSISNGFNLYISDMEQAIMTNQPVSIQQTTIDLEEMQNAMMDSTLDEKNKFPKDPVIYPYDNSDITNISQYTNNLSDKFINFMKDTDPSLYRSIDVLRNLSFHVMTKSDDGSYTPMDVSANGSLSGIMSMFSGSGKNVSFNQMVSNKDYVLEHYDLLKGSYPENDNDVILVLDSYNRISTTILSVLGYKNLESGVTLDFDEILKERNTINVLSNDQYFYEGNYGLYDKISAKDDPATLQQYYENPFFQLNIVGIMRVKPDDTSTMLSTGICFQEGIAKTIFKEAEESAIFKAQAQRMFAEYTQKQPITSILTGEELTLTNLNDLTSINFRVTVLGQEIPIPGLSEISAINIYPKDLNSKEKIVERIDEWNQKNPSNTIKYADAMSFMFSSFQMILSAITYVLIAFVAISLVVSTVMIGIITYVSVIERTKEIGVLRAIGARKKDISRVFNAETLSIGFSSGFLGIFVSWLLLFPINLILQHFTQIPNLAVLSPWHALILLGISMLLTFISGLIPSRIASKKDPILALRSD